MKKTMTQLLTTTSESLKDTILDQPLTSIKDACLKTNLPLIPSLLLKTQNLLAKHDSQDTEQEDAFQEAYSCHSESTPWVLESGRSFDLGPVGRTRSQSGIDIFIFAKCPFILPDSEAGLPACPSPRRSSACSRRSTSIVSADQIEVKERYFLQFIRPRIVENSNRKNGSLKCI